MGQMIRKLFWWMIVGSIAVAIIRVFPWSHPNDVWVMAGNYANDFGAWITKIVNGSGALHLPKPGAIHLPTPQK
jgi:hypothetical protein